MRVIRTCHELGIRAVAVYSDVDRDALHVRLADEAYPIGPASPRESYLATGKLVEVARRAKCDAVHPGYGFLAENADFADAVQGAGLAFVGPPGDVQRRLGEKTRARRIARDAGVPVAEGTLEPLRDLDHARREAKRIGYPVMLKAAGGGGGKGMRAVASASELDAAWRLASGEAAGAFGSSALFVEKLIEHARHVEMQIFADSEGGMVWLGERDCSIQRRNQKLIEESPAPSVDDALRERLGDAALRIARAAGYQNAGTVEFLVDASGAFSFLEVNTRLQVEHPVTEMVTGLDLVALQLRVAAGEPLPIAQREVRRRGAAIECRVTAEDARRGFVPATGRIALLREPAGPGVRVDSGLFDGLTVTSDYDPLLMKVIAHGADRSEALARARRAVRETIVAGLPTSLAFHAHVLNEPDFVAGRYDTGYVATHWPPRSEARLDDSAVTAAALVAVLATRGRTTRRPVASPDGAWSRAGREEALR
ncbi:MAG TPA: biotin carboxylase N-terminal domain-containing protein [Candidatus Limnocylindria bacterium]|nr:biotin carboxylase N-terminal domain-containing protein [Candidatus Limnocylindria bacterium]